MTAHWIQIVDGSRFRCPVGERVLVAMERCGESDIGVGCRGGGCGICRVRVARGRYRTGKMSQLQVTDQDRAAGYVLACRLYPLEDVVIELCD